MAEIEITLPTVQYGNVKARFSPEEFGLTPTDQLVDPSALGMAAAVYLNLFIQGFKAGSEMDVEAPQAASQQPPRTISQVMSDEDVDTEAEAAAIIKKELGATEIPVGAVYDHAPDDVVNDLESDDAPWNKTSAADVKPKPWEAGASAPAKVAEIDW